MENATGLSMNQFVQQKLRPVTGMGGVFLPSGYNNVYFSTARNMARFGLLMLNKGTWNTTPVLTDTSYFREMINSSNALNKSYGYLWWLNGKESFMIPQSQFVFQGMLSPDAHSSMYSALGKNGQILNIVPELNIVTVRMGDAPGTIIEVPMVYNNEIWKILKQVINYTPASIENETNQTDVKGIVIYPNPATDHINFLIPETDSELEVYIYSVLGEEVTTGKNISSINISHLLPGVYQLVTKNRGKIRTIKFVKTR
jgi:CubicO group peptidase (beta-lactamase class C family)